MKVSGLDVHKDSVFCAIIQCMKQLILLWPLREIHHPASWFLQGLIINLRSNPNHQLVPHDPGAHFPVDQVTNTPHHILFLSVHLFITKGPPDAIVQ